MAPGFVARDLKMSRRLHPQGISELRLDAVNSEDHRINVRVSGPPESRTAEIRIEEPASSARFITSPWPNRGKPTGDLSRVISEIAKIPATVSGGNVAAEGLFSPNGAARFSGNLSVTEAVVIHLPRILNLLALKSRRDLEASAEIQNLTLDHIVADQKQLVIGHIGLRGTSFVGKLRIDHFSYGLVDEQINLDGSFFGVGFEVLGTRSDRQVYLQDNALIRAFGRPNEFDFGPQPKK